MKVLVVGSGGREHTLAWKLKQSAVVTDLVCAPGNAGTARLGTNVAIQDTDLSELRRFAEECAIDLTVVGPEAPLAAGIVDSFRESGLKIAGPTASAARLEGSKGFAKNFMQQHAIPTAAFQICESAEDAEAALRSGRFSFPVVLKADGLAAGKGVFICEHLDAALGAVTTIMRERTFGRSGDRIVIEDFLSGEETSFMVFTDGKEILPMVPSQDHKAIFDGDKGPNTGGMGAYSIERLLSDRLRRRIMTEIVEPAVSGMAAGGHPFRGVLYAGLMLTEEGPQVLEFNVRFGDPETQVVLPRLESDLVEVFAGVAEDDIGGVELDWSKSAAVCVVAASEGYPGSYSTGRRITGVAAAEADPATTVFHAGTKEVDGELVTGGGRVLGVTALDTDLARAIDRAYTGLKKIRFDGIYYRTDIGKKGLAKQSNG